MPISMLLQEIDRDAQYAKRVLSAPQLSEREWRLFDAENIAQKLPGSTLLILQLGQSRTLCDIEILDMLAQMQQYDNFSELKEHPTYFLSKAQKQGITPEKCLDYVRNIMASRGSKNSMIVGLG